MKKNYLSIVLAFISCIAYSQLNPGDVVFTGYQSDDPDAFSFVILVDIPALTPIEFTDNGWGDPITGGFRIGEGFGSWTSPDSALPAGTEVIISGLTATTGAISANNIALTVSGDQLFAYDPLNIPTSGDQSGFYAGIQMNGNWDAGASGTNDSAQPSALIGFSMFISPEVDNAVYDCSTVVGTPAELRTAIYNSANWTKSNDVLTMPNCAFNPTLSAVENNNKEFILVPNPTSTGYVIIKTATNDMIEVSVFDVLGKQVLKQTLLNDRLDVSSLNSGVYVMRLSQNNNMVTKKLIIN